ncbi:ABC transporter permease [Leptolyngbya sp. FACHB-261]|uniref:ABC transporter permease n=1 Tax=Leptolyngbya sp. FACHB-261 TaxID=2692806 RepID=UPI001683F718|nr:ABC transporter permease [Leptolyngbya sp. FACHB-261]MBD2101474.1 ABC transporter permease [Leptolyngbya sp. FACHB-261]
MHKQLVSWLDGLLGSRFWALFRKELAQILHNPQMVRIILVPPTVMLLLYGFALNPDFKDLKVGIADYSQSSASRELIEIFEQTDALTVSNYYTSASEMADALARGNLTVGVTIPPEFAEDIARGRSAQVQVLYDAVDANTASIASGYVTQLVSDYNLRQRDNRPGVASSARRAQVQLKTLVLYNQGLDTAWFIVPGMIGVLLTVIGSQLASTSVVREKEAGTIEQLLMTPASNTEVILAKICPLLVLLIMDACIALTVARLVFGVPLRGNFLVFLGVSSLYFWVGISIGILLASFSKSQQQAQLTAFFINPPMVILSGATSPTSAMPPFMQFLSHLDPLRYFIEVCRGVLLKGVGLESLWPQVLTLLAFALVLMTLSIRQFRRQLQ